MLSCLPFLAPLTFAAFLHLEAELCRTGGFSKNSPPFLGVIFLEPGQPFLYLQDPEGCAPSE